MYEVYTGTRPGKPVLLLCIVAIVLVGTLGLAWVQVVQARAFGPPIRIPGTPLEVRAPREWKQQRDDPGTFVLPVQRLGERAAITERRVTFRYRRWPTYQPLRDIIQALSWQDAARPLEAQPAKIGTLPAIQVRRLRQFQYRGQIIQQENLLRVACSPRGDVITIEYVPLSGLAIGDLELVDEIAAAVRLVDPAFQSRGSKLLEDAGLTLPLDANWQVIGPDFPEIPGVYVQSQAGGVPAWSLGIFRTWLASGRTPRDLIEDFSRNWWQLSPEDAAVREWGRGDGASIVVLEHPRPSADSTAIVAVWAISVSAAETAMVFVCADAGERDAAQGSAERFVNELGFRPTQRLPDLPNAERAGRDLVELIERKGGTPWWGRPAEPHRSFYVGDYAGSTFAGVQQRSAVGAEDGGGYRGFEAYIFDSSGEGDTADWQIDARASGYSYELEMRYRIRGADAVTRVRERRRAGASTIERVVNQDRRSQTLRIPVGPSFLAPPAESLAEAWIAEQDAGYWLIEASNRRGDGTHTRLLRPLSPSESGHRRVLLIEDYWPRGAVLSFNQDRDLLKQLHPAGRMERVSPEEALRSSPALNRMLGSPRP